MPREDPPLPAWARVLARSLPRTAAAMLELDDLHRARSPLGAALSARLRWVAADALRCDTGRAIAAADYARAGATPEEIRRLVEREPLEADVE